MTESLYERLGGAKGIAALVDGIVEAHMGNPAIQAKFLPYRNKPDVMARVKKHTCDFLGSGSGGPEKYEGRSMPDTHRGMKITEAEYAAVADDIQATLERHKIDRRAREEVSAIVQSLKDQIIGI